MLHEGPLVLVDDDIEDQELLLLAVKELGLNREIKRFNDAETALKFLYESAEQPFMIISDINMPKMDGITFQKTIDGCRILQPKCIPFIFLSTSTKFVRETCDLNIQGYFEKSSSWHELRETVKIVLSYWQRTRHLGAN